MAIPRSMMKNKENLKYKKEFERIFNLKFNKFFNLITGFDIVLLDDVLKPPDGTSLKQMIVETYGDEAKELILTLIGKE